MKTTIAILLIGVVAASFAWAEDYPGYRYLSKLREERTISDTPEFATLFITLADERLERDIAIRYEVKTRRVVGAWWMTKGMFDFRLPEMPLRVPEQPKDEQNMTIILSAEKIADIQEEKIALVGIHWGKGPK